MNQRTELLVIDPQFDFCDPAGNLYVGGAENDITRLAAMITRCKGYIDDIHCTLDMHHLVDIAHPIFWQNAKGEHPGPFTIINLDDIQKGLWRTTNPAFLSRATEYVKALASGSRYPLCIWPPHCLIGSLGSTVMPELWNAFNAWEQDFAMVDYVTKGSNFWTEHYSAVKAEVPDPEDSGTQLNVRLIEILQKADVIAISGQALSHCVSNTIRDIADNFGEDNIKKFILLEDTSSPVQGFEQMGIDFVSEMTARGMQVMKSTDFLK